MQQYAVISIRTKPRRERLVIAYSDEKDLRDLFAAPSILGLGYRSPVAAVADVDDCIPATLASDQDLKAAHVDPITWSPRKVGSKQWPFRCKIKPAGIRHTVLSLLQHSLAAAVVVLYSKNVLSAAVRALIAF